MKFFKTIMDYLRDIAPKERSMTVFCKFLRQFKVPNRDFSVKFFKIFLDLSRYDTDDKQNAIFYIFTQFLWSST